MSLLIRLARLARRHAYRGPMFPALLLIAFASWFAMATIPAAHRSAMRVTGWVAYALASRVDGWQASMRLVAASPAARSMLGDPIHAVRFVEALRCTDKTCVVLQDVTGPLASGRLLAYTGKGDRRDVVVDAHLSVQGVVYRLAPREELVRAGPSLEPDPVDGFRYESIESPAGSLGDATQPGEEL